MSKTKKALNPAKVPAKSKPPKKPSDKQIQAMVDKQLNERGIAAVTVNDGTVLVFTEAALGQLHTAATGKGQLILFVQRGES